MANATKTDQPTQGQSIHLIKRCLKYFRPYKGQIFLSMLAMGVVSLSTAGSAWLVKPALDEIFINKDEQALLYVPLLFFVLTLVKGAGRYVQNYFMQYSGLRVLEKLRSELYDKIIYLPLQFYEESQVGMLMSRIINDVTMIRNSLPSIVMMVRQLLTMLGLVGVVFYQNPRLAVWAVLVLPAALYPLVWFGRKLRKYGRRNQSKLADISVVLQEVFSGIRVVKAFATERHEARRFDDENERLARLYLKQASVSELSSPIMELIGAVGIGLVIWFGGHEVIAGETTAGTFFSFVAALAMMYDPVKSLNSYNMEVQRALAGAERVFEILDAPELTVEQGGDTPFDEPFRELRFDGVTFTYGSKTAPALDNVSLTVRAGERVAIVGPSGAGKSTFVNLIPRFYEPQQGAIILNGRPVSDYTLETLRRNVSMVSQDTFLFNLPVRDNITYGLSGAIDEDTVRAAAMSAYADEFIRELPEGYDTLLGERGVKLSGGQKQRLTIARAIMKDAPLLILDEATSALDSEAERIVQKALDNLMENRTSIVIAHRLSTILSADRILVMEQGRIVDAGRHEELLARCPMYARLYAMQFATDAANAVPASVGDPVDMEQGAAVPATGATA
uniref:ABC transporter related n=1 Tax=Nitratidesulfovibrio vulgaris (strain DSM 19637 / Miyazaki F) TaxID=883 RepID=B8DJK2_NITV9